MPKPSLPGRICGWFAAVTGATRGASWAWQLASESCDEKLHCFEWSHWISICQCVVSTTVFGSIWIHLHIWFQIVAFKDYLTQPWWSSWKIMEVWRVRQRNCVVVAGRSCQTHVCLIWWQLQWPAGHYSRKQLLVAQFHWHHLSGIHWKWDETGSFPSSLLQKVVFWKAYVSKIFPNQKLDDLQPGQVEQVAVAWFCDLGSYWNASDFRVFEDFHSYLIFLFLVWAVTSRTEAAQTLGIL